MTDKKEHKYLEKLLKDLYSLENKEKQKIEIAQKLLEFFNNCANINLNFELLISSLDELREYSNFSSKKLWLRIILSIIRFKAEYKSKLYDKILNIIYSFHLNNKILIIEDNILRVKAIMTITNNCSDIRNISVDFLLNIFFFDCILVQKLYKKKIFTSILNIIQYDYNQKERFISKFLFDLIIEVLILISFNIFINLKDLNQKKNPNNISIKNDIHQISSNSGKNDSIEYIIDNQKNLLKIIISIFDIFINKIIQPKANLIKGIILINCFLNNIEREYSWKAIRQYIYNFSNKIINELLDILLSKNFYLEFSCLERYLFYDQVKEYNENILLESYIPYIKLSEEKISNFLLKSKSKFIAGAIFFIGMAVWGYEKIENLRIPYTIIISHFYKLVQEKNRIINKDIIICLKRLIKKYGEILYDEWNEIIDIILLLIDNINRYSIKENNCKELIEEDEILNQKRNNNNYYIEITNKNINEVIDIIRYLLINDKFFGNKDKYKKLNEKVFDLPKSDEKKDKSNIPYSNISKNIFKIQVSNINQLESLLIDNFMK